MIPITWEALTIEDAYKLDLLIENKLVVTLKSAHQLHLVFFKQIRSQLSLLNLKHGIILNCKVDLMKEGIHRVFNNAGDREHY
jgi:GxxExxY protein